MSLVADSLDMLPDSFVYGISLLAVGGTLIKKKRIAKLAGYFQIALAIIGFMEVFKENFRRRKPSKFFDNDYRFPFCTYCKRHLHFTKLKEKRRSTYEGEFDLHLK